VTDTARAESPTALELPTYLVFYDGVCAYCDSAVRQLVKTDRKHMLRYASLQGDTAASLRSRWPKQFPEGRISSMVFIDSSSGDAVVYTRARAIRHIFEVLGLKARRPKWLHRTPMWLADLGYRLFAATRYRRFGKFDECQIPPAESRDLFLP